MSRRSAGCRGRTGGAPAVLGKGAEGKALPPALGSESSHTGVAGQLRLRKGPGDKTRHVFVIYLCGKGTV